MLSLLCHPTTQQVIGYSGFRFPITLALWHMLLGTLTSRAMLAAQQAPDAIKEARSRSLNLQLAGVGVLFGGVLVTGNAALLYLTVPTVQMLKVCCVVWAAQGSLMISQTQQFNNAASMQRASLPDWLGWTAGCARPRPKCCPQLLPTSTSLLLLPLMLLLLLLRHGPHLLFACLPACPTTPRRRQALL